MSTIVLSKPVPHGDEEIAELSLRELTTADLVKCGYPVQILDSGATVPNTPAIAGLIARLAGVPPSVVNKLSAKDFNLCMGVVMGFLGEAEAG